MTTWVGRMEGNGVEWSEGMAVKDYLRVLKPC